MVEKYRERRYDEEEMETLEFHQGFLEKINEVSPLRIAILCQ